MADPNIQSLPEDEAIEQIVDTVQQADVGDAPFALVLGSGFSQGLVPTARELVTESLPLWKSPKAGQPSDTHRELSATERSNIACDFWKTFVNRNQKRGLRLDLDPKTGLPQSYADAYRAAFESAYFGAVGAPAEARKFQRALMRLDKPRLNAAHFLLASLLGVQPGKTRPSELFKASSAFCRLILTTNFDPFLQTALQAVNRLYFMSDTPELGVGDEIFDDQTDAVHLVYLHGSIHRRSQAATDEDIKGLKEKNAQTLAPVLKRHGIIVLGYSGWDDAIVEALAACDRFDYRLYWCGRETSPLAKDAFGPRVASILSKPSALYVQTAGAGPFMAQLVGKLVKGLPRLLDNPIGQLREMLETIDLSELRNLAARSPAPANTSSLGAIASHPDANAFVSAQESALRRLGEAEQIFRGMTSSAETKTEKANAEGPQPSRVPPDAGGPSTPTDITKTVKELLASAQVAATLGNHAEAIRLCTEALNRPIEDLSEVIDLSFARALAYFALEQLDDAIADWTRITNLPGISVENTALALRNIGVSRHRQGRQDEALNAYTRLIELPNPPIDQLAAALRNRGVIYSNLGKHDLELADYNRLIEQTPDAPPEGVAAVLANRGVLFDDDGDFDKAIADYKRVIEMPEAPVESLTLALRNRGIILSNQGHTTEAIADYSTIIDKVQNPPVDDLAAALRNRANLLFRAGKTEEASHDYSRVLLLLGAAPEHLAVAEGSLGWLDYTKGDFASFLAKTKAALAKVPTLDFAAFNLGLALLGSGEDEKALQAYRDAAGRFPHLIETNGIRDLEEAKKKGWLSEARSKPVIELLQTLKK